MNTRIEYWLQERNKLGAWKDSGPDKSPKAVFRNIDQLQRSNPKGQWRCIERSVVDIELSREDAEKY
jgi:hypothetical protein